MKLAKAIRYYKVHKNRENIRFLSDGMGIPKNQRNGDTLFFLTNPRDWDFRQRGCIFQGWRIPKSPVTLLRGSIRVYQVCIISTFGVLDNFGPSLNCNKLISRSIFRSEKNSKFCSIFATCL